MISARDPQVRAALPLTLSFARTEAIGDPYAFRLGMQRYVLFKDGGVPSEVQLQWDDDLLAHLAAVRLPHRDPNIVQQLGEKLRQILEPAGWSDYESLIQDAVQAKRKVVLTLRSGAAEIYALPWELVTMKITGQHVGELPGVLIRYEWPGAKAVPLDKSQEEQGERILLGWSAAGGAVPVAEHVSSLDQASRGGEHFFDWDQDVLPHLSLNKLGEALETARTTNRPIRILHLLCHGGASHSNFGLTLDSENSESCTIADAVRLRQVLAPYVGMVRLIVLSACDSGNAGQFGNRIGSLAQALHRIGFAKVLASRYPISVPGATQLAAVLYRELLAQKRSLEEALLVARQTMFRDNAHLDWASLQLYVAVEAAPSPSDQENTLPKPPPLPESPSTTWSHPGVDADPRP